MGIMWNPWHGCKKYSAGCKNCYVYRTDAKFSKDAGIISLTKTIDLPIRKKRDGSYKYPSKTLFWTCFTSDFLLEDADLFRIKAWEYIKERSDCHFFFITKRIIRLETLLPDDWEEGYQNVTIGVTCENQEEADLRLSIFKSLPVKYKVIILEPLLEKITLERFLPGDFKLVIAGGESGAFARKADYSWFLAIREECRNNKISFTFKQTGAYFIKDQKEYQIPRKYQHTQARKADINLSFEEAWPKGYN